MEPTSATPRATRPAGAVHANIYQSVTCASSGHAAGSGEKVLSSPNPTHSLGGHPRRTEALERNHQRTLDHNPLLQEIQQQKNSVAELQRCEMIGPDDPTIARIETERLKLHDLKLKLTVAKQMEVDRDITKATKDVSVKTDKDQMQTAWGIWRHYRSSISTDGCH